MDGIFTAENLTKTFGSGKTPSPPSTTSRSG